MSPRRAFLIVLTFLGAALLALGGVLLARTVLVGASAVPATAVAGGSGDADAASASEADLAPVERLSGALRIATVSRREGPPARSLARFHAYLESRFPLVHRELEREVVAGGSLLYTWSPGGGAAAAGAADASRPLVLLAHQDVVPVERGTKQLWTKPPFAGAVADGYVWGRGALDDKGALLAILEAVESMLGDGASPPVPVILAFGHDEEVGGRGAEAMAARLARRGVQPLLVLDEGLAVVEGMLPGVERPIALVGVAEKGYLSLELVARAEGGHSSAPPAETAVDMLAAALVRLRGAPMPARVDGAVAEMLVALAPELPFDQRLVMANLWLFRPLVARRLARETASAALVRTTTAPTMLRGSGKDNVLPAEARAVVNFRIHPRDSGAAVLAHVRRAIADARIAVEPYGEFSTEPSPVSPTDGEGYALLARTIGEIVPEAVVAPGLVLGGTDARHYTGLTDRIYRFAPVTIRPGDLERIHGTDERLAITEYQRMIRFYRRLIENAGAG